MAQGLPLLLFKRHTLESPPRDAPAPQAAVRNLTVRGMPSRRAGDISANRYF
jgi:hypothetical protein